MDPKSLRHLLAAVGAGIIGLAWAEWGLSTTLIGAFAALVFLDAALWIWQRREDERPPRLED